MSSSLLVVDDDDHIRAMLQRGLGYEGFQVTVASDGEHALGLLRARPVDCIVLDVRMPDVDGLEVCRRLRHAGDSTPIIILTAYDTVGDRVTGLEAGADDYLVKPFAFEEWLARGRALLRRRQVGEAPVLRFADLSLDRSALEVTRAGRRIMLTPREFELLEAFMRRPRQVLSRDELLARVWGYDFETDTNVVDVYVLYLRRKLEAAGEPRLVHTVRGAGYALREG
jgi:two-component system, OmpR family, response regulator MprA